MSIEVWRLFLAEVGGRNSYLVAAARSSRDISDLGLFPRVGSNDYISEERRFKMLEKALLRGHGSVNLSSRRRRPLKPSRFNNSPRTQIPSDSNSLPYMSDTSLASRIKTQAHYSRPSHHPNHPPPSSKHPPGTFETPSRSSPYPPDPSR